MQSKDGKIAIDYWEENQFEYLPMLLDTLNIVSILTSVAKRGKHFCFSKCR